MSTVIFIRRLPYHPAKVSLLNLVCCLGLTLLAACSSPRDLYMPYKPVHSPTSHSGSENRVSMISAESRPGWITSLSPDYFVGYGSGSSVFEAQERAIEDIKIKIIKAMGESVGVYEHRSLSNVVLSRSDMSSASILHFSHRFQNAFSPVIHFDHAHVKDYHYEREGSSFAYFIRYAIDANEIHELKKKCLEQQTMQRSLIDSLTRISDITDIRVLAQRFEDLQYMVLSINNIRKDDSLRIASAMDKIHTLIDNLEIVIERDNGHTIKLFLRSQGRILHYSVAPLIKTSGSVHIQRVYQQAHYWIIEYAKEASAASLKILFNIEGFELEHTLWLDREQGHAAAARIVSIRITVLEIKRWDDQISKIRIDAILAGDDIGFVQEVSLALKPSNFADYSLNLNRLTSRQNGAVIHVSQDVSCAISRRYMRAINHGSARVKYSAGSVSKEIFSPQIPVQIIFP